MARLARVIAPGHGRHVSPRGNRRRRTFFSNAGYEACPALRAGWRAQYRAEVRACRVMLKYARVMCVPLPDARETGAIISQTRAEMEVWCRLNSPEFRIGNLAQMKKERNRKGRGNEP